MYAIRSYYGELAVESAAVVDDRGLLVGREQAGAGVGHAVRDAYGAGDGAFQELVQGTRVDSYNFV